VDTETDTEGEYDSKRARSESPAEEIYAELKEGDVAAVPTRINGETYISLALVIQAPNKDKGVPGTGLFLETSAEVRAAGCADPRPPEKEGLWLTNTHVSLETAYKMSEGFEKMILGLFWEVNHGPESTREVLDMTRQYAEYLCAVRKESIAGAVPECCRGELNAALSRGAPKTDAEIDRLRHLLSQHDPERMPFSKKTVCVACGSTKQCTHRLGQFPLGRDCAHVLRGAKKVCDLVDALQKRTQIPYPHEFQRMLEDAGALGQ
jgi:hypothetical protein